MTQELKDLTVEQLKAMAYDLIIAINRGREKLAVIEQQIKRLDLKTE